MKNFDKQKNKAYPAKRKRCGGFTLVETLVALSIFSVSILGLMSVLGAGLADTSYAKQKIAGTYLAQEGVEYLRNMRDTDVLTDASGGWSTFRDTPVSADSYPTENPELFTRFISVTEVDNDEVTISSTVSWSQPSGPQSVTFSENLYNWIE